MDDLATDTAINTVVVKLHKVASLVLSTQHHICTEVLPDIRNATYDPTSRGGTGISNQDLPLQLFVENSYLAYFVSMVTNLGRLTELSESLVELIGDSVVLSHTRSYCCRTKAPRMRFFQAFICY